MKNEDIKHEKHIFLSCNKCFSREQGFSHIKFACSASLYIDLLVLSLTPPPPTCFESNFALTLKRFLQELGESSAPFAPLTGATAYIRFTMATYDHAKQK